MTLADHDQYVLNAYVSNKVLSNGHTNLKLRNKSKTGNVAIANALQLEAAQAMPALSLFNYDIMPSLMSPNLSIAVL